MSHAAVAIRACEVSNDLLALGIVGAETRWIGAAETTALDT